MKYYSLRTVIDDILLLVRNSAISESEDLSRAQIASWVMQYRDYYKKKESDADEETGDDQEDDDTYSSTLTLTLEEDTPWIKKAEVPALLENTSGSILSVMDSHGCPFQKMERQRRHLHWYRPYTWKEVTWWYDDGYLYVTGAQEALEDLDEVVVVLNLLYGTTDDDDEDAVTIPGWMIPLIKKAILSTELSFTLKRPSDSEDNSSLADIKPEARSLNKEVR